MLESQQVGTKHLREGGQVVWDYSPPGVLRLPIESGWSRNDSLFGWQLRSDFQREDTSAFTLPDSLSVFNPAYSSPSTPF